MDNVREAAELIREYLSSCSMYSVPAENEAAWTLARAYLAETDPTPITEDWLRIVGFETDADRYPDFPAFYSPRSGSSPHDCRITFNVKEGDDGWFVGECADASVPPPANRGGLRLLARALGIALTAPSVSGDRPQS